MTPRQECLESVIWIISYILDRRSDSMKIRLCWQYHFLISKICLLHTISICLSNHSRKGSIPWIISSRRTSTVSECSDAVIMKRSSLWMIWNRDEWQWFQVRIATRDLQSENVYDIRMNNQFRRIRRNIWWAEILNDGSVTIFSNFFTMWLFSWLFEVAKLPFSVAADVATMGLRVADKWQSFTWKKCEEIDDAFRD